MMLPLGGTVPDDYCFQAANGRGQVRFSELFSPGKNTLVIYSFMFGQRSSASRTPTESTDARSSSGPDYKPEAPTTSEPPGRDCHGIGRLTSLPGYLFTNGAL
jgi:hypothetical protein